MRSEPAYALADRIAAGIDPGFISTGGATNVGAANRARAVGRRKDTVRGWGPGEVHARRSLFLLEEMLKNQSGVNVRLPSHHAAPFRAFAYVSQANGVVLDSGAAPAADVTADLLTVDFGSGITEVTKRHRGVISNVSVVGTIDPASVSIVDPASVITFNLLRNGLPVPGYVKRPVDSSLGFLTGVGVTGAPAELSGKLPVPIHLKGGDEVTVEAVLDAVSAGALYGGRVSIRVEGWLYPVRIDQDSIAGTLVD